jgi:hypothetical protein
VNITEVKKLQTGDRVHWDGGNDSVQAPCSACVKRHERDDMSDVIELVWDDEEPSLLMPIAHLSEMRPILENLRKVEK